MTGWKEKVHLNDSASKMALMWTDEGDGQGQGNRSHTLLFDEVSPRALPLSLRGTEMRERRIGEKEERKGEKEKKEIREGNRVEKGGSVLFLERSGCPKKGQSW